MVDGSETRENTTMNGVTLNESGAAGYEQARVSRGIAAGLAVLLMALIGFSVWTSEAESHVGLTGFEIIPSDTQAGGHPNVRLEMTWDASTIKNGEFNAPPNNPCVCDDPRRVIQQFPTGFIGNPHATPRCEIVEFSFGRCPPASQIGTAEPFGNPEGEALYVPLYNLVPHPDEPSLTAFWAPLVGAPVFITLGSRTDSDYGLYAEGSAIYHPLVFPGLNINLWGVPADPVHDPERFTVPLKGFAACGSIFGCNEVTGASANVPLVPYLQAPTTCGVPLTAAAELEYYTGDYLTRNDAWPATTGCEQLTFNPSLTAQPTTTDADSPSGLDIELSVPQELSPTTPSPSQIKASTTVLPKGFSLNSNAADGKVACADAASAIGTRGPATCPEFSKVGSLTLDSTALPEAIPGAIYLLEPTPEHRYRILLAADGFGTHMKLAGFVQPDSETGQLTVSFPDLPQSPLTAFNMHFFGAERGLLATPSHCGTYAVESEFVPWNNALPPQRSVSQFSVTTGPDGRPCPNTPRPFSPTLKAGTSNTTAGMHSAFAFELSRPDGDQTLEAVSFEGPPGFAATVKGVGRCPDSALAAIASPSRSGAAEAAAPLCPASSRIGTTMAGAGAGSQQLHLPGRAYLAGPYKGAPLSMAIVTPAVSGPYDLGNVVVRASLDVDPVSAQVSAVSDPLPKILGGIPLRLRNVRVDLDRQGFTYNPTSCDPFAVRTTITGSEGGVASPQVPFQVASCVDLSYGPKLGLFLSGGLKRRGHPAIRAVLTTAQGEANTRRVSVALPKSGLLDNSHLDTICTRPQFAAGSCPEGSRIGTAEAETPILDEPLRGGVFLRSSNNKLPDMVVDLQGEFDIELSARIDSVRGRMRATFQSVPDAPVTKFTLRLLGGDKGLLQNSTNLCRSTQRATVRMVGQNGMRSQGKVRMQTNCGSDASRRKRSSKKAGR
jgi:hypothetical protein